MKEGAKITVEGISSPCQYAGKMKNGKHKILVFETMNPPHGIKYWYPVLNIETKHIKEVS